MTPYGDGTSGVIAYKLFEDAIEAMFKDGEVYHYSTKRIARHHIEKMKELAKRGKCLTTYINQNEEVRDYSDFKY
jgi:hypothetical protein